MRQNRSPIVHHGDFRAADISDLVAWRDLRGVFESNFDPASLTRIHVPEGDIFYANELRYWLIQECGYASTLKFCDTLEGAMGCLIAII